VETLLVGLISSIGTLGLIAVLLLFFWDRVELLLSRAMRIIGGTISFFRFLKKKSIQLDIQSRINIFASKVAKLSKDLGTPRVKVEWIDKNIGRKAFIESDTVILRLRDDDTNDENFVHGAYLFVSKCLLLRVKHHLGPSQKESIDLYVTANMIRDQHNGVIDMFVETYLQPALETNKKEKEYFLKYEMIDEHGLFYPVLINELNFIGKRVFGKVGRYSIVTEFDEIIEFLFQASKRKIGDDTTNLEFVGKNTRILIVIIGKKQKISDEQRYVDYMKSVTSKHSIDGIYAVGDSHNRRAIDSICRKLCPTLSIIQSGTCPVKLDTKDGRKLDLTQYYVVLRKNETHLVI
jgi:hypothetical protein